MTLPKRHLFLVCFDRQFLDRLRENRRNRMMCRHPDSFDSFVGQADVVFRKGGQAGLRARQIVALDFLHLAAERIVAGKLVQQ
jgi:hypothetical protein